MRTRDVKIGGYTHYRHAKKYILKIVGIPEKYSHGIIVETRIEGGVYDGMSQYYYTRDLVHIPTNKPLESYL